MDQLTMDDISIHHHYLQGLLYSTSDLVILKEGCSSHITRFIRTFTDPGAHRSKLLKLTREKYG